MSTNTGLSGFFHKLGSVIASFFGSHQAVIQAVITDATQAAAIASAAAAMSGEPGAEKITGKIWQVADGLDKVSAAVAAEATATSLSEHAQNLANLTASLVSSGDIGVKNPDTIAAVGALATKVQNVVGALETAALVQAPAQQAPVQTAAKIPVPLKQPPIPVIVIQDDAPTSGSTAGSPSEPVKS